MARAWVEAAGGQILDRLLSEVALVDAEGRIVYANRAWQGFSDRNEGEPGKTGVGADYLEACSNAGEVGQDAAALLHSILSGASESGALEYPCHSKTEQRWFRMRCFRINAPPAVAAIVHDDLTDHYLMQRAERDLRIHALKIEETARREAHARLALNTISHALRTPLTPVLLWMERLQRFDTSREVAETARKMKDSIERLVRAVDEAVDAVALAERPVRRTTLQPGEAARRITNAVARINDMEKVVLNVRGSAPADVDADLVGQAVGLLVRMAKGRDPNGVAHLSIDFADPLEVIVKDTGSSAADEASDLHFHGSDGDASLGLALASCQKVAQLHGGAFDIRRDGGVNVHRLSIPHRSDDAPLKARALSPEAPIPAKA